MTEQAGQPILSPPAVPQLQQPPEDKVWVLRRWDRNDDVVALYPDERCALAGLAEYVHLSWDNVAGQDGVPEQPPADDREAVRLYFGPDRDSRPDEGYHLYAEEVERRDRTRRTRIDYAFPDETECDQANRNAVFHPKIEPEGVPYIEIAGMLVFVCLDDLTGVLVSVDLDMTEDRLVRPDGTVPLRVEVQGAVVLDDSTERRSLP